MNKIVADYAEHWPSSPLPRGRHKRLLSRLYRPDTEPGDTRGTNFADNSHSVEISPDVCCGLPPGEVRLPSCWPVPRASPGCGLLRPAQESITHGLIRLLRDTWELVESGDWWIEREEHIPPFLASSSTCIRASGEASVGHLISESDAIFYFTGPFSFYWWFFTFYKLKSAGPQGSVIFIGFCRKWNTVVFLISLRNIYFLKMLYFMFSENIKCKSSLETRRKSLGYLWIEENFCNFRKIYLKRVNVGYFLKQRYYYI